MVMVLTLGLQADEDNILTFVSTVQTPSQTETMVITIKKMMDGSKYCGIIRTQSGDHKFFVPSVLLNFKQKGKNSYFWACGLVVLLPDCTRIEKARKSLRKGNSQDSERQHAKRGPCNYK